MTTRERLERKAERREEWAETREEKAASANIASGRAVEGIPFGQPILVGHHSERRHRKALERCHNAMSRSVEHSDMAEHHRVKANGIRRKLDRSIFSDDDNAIEQLEKRIAARERSRDINNAINKIVRGKPKNERTDEKLASLCELLGLDIGNPDNRCTLNKLFEPDFCGRVGIPAYVNQNLSGNIKADRDRLAELKVRRDMQEKAESSDDGISVEIRNGWAFVTFTEKPDWEVRQELKDAGFRWRNGSWQGASARLPERYRQTAAQEPERDPAYDMVMEATGENNY